MDHLIIGVDPGQTTGICIYGPGGSDLAQCTPGVVLPVVAALALNSSAPVLLAVERFVVGPRASRSSSAKAGQTTRELIGALVELGARAGIHVVQRSASEVKPWATDARLERAGLLAPSKGMPHARDGGRQALFAAVKDCGLPDPLSRNHRSPR